MYKENFRKLSRELMNLLWLFSSEGTLLNDKWSVLKSFYMIIWVCLCASAIHGNTSNIGIGFVAVEREFGGFLQLLCCTIIATVVAYKTNAQTHQHGGRLMLLLLLCDKRLAGCCWNWKRWPKENQFPAQISGASQKVHWFIFADEAA